MLTLLLSGALATATETHELNLKPVPRDARELELPKPLPSGGPVVCRIRYDDGLSKTDRYQSVATDADCYAAGGHPSGAEGQSPEHDPFTAPNTRASEKPRELK